MFISCMFRKIWRWVHGYDVCYVMHESGQGFCKRRKGHLGKHKTSTEKLEWR